MKYGYGMASLFLISFFVATNLDAAPKRDKSPHKKQHDEKDKTPKKEPSREEKLRVAVQELEAARRALEEAQRELGGAQKVQEQVEARYGDAVDREMDELNELMQQRIASKRVARERLAAMELSGISPEIIHEQGSRPAIDRDHVARVREMQATHEQGMRVFREAIKVAQARVNQAQVAVAVAQERVAQAWAAYDALLDVSQSAVSAAAAKSN